MTSLTTITNILARRRVHIKPDNYIAYEIPLGTTKYYLYDWLYKNTTGNFYLMWQKIAFENEGDALWFSCKFGVTK